MIHTLKKHYYGILKENFRVREEELKNVPKNREARAALYGAGLPIYLHRERGTLVKKYIYIEATIQEVTEKMSVAAIHAVDSAQFSLLDLIQLLSVKMYEKNLYGITATIGDNVINITHPIVLQHLLETVEPENPIFDNILIYFLENDEPVGDCSEMQKQLNAILATISKSNSKQFKLTTDFTYPKIKIKEEYDNEVEFDIIVPIQTAYSGTMMYPYYGIELIHTSHDSDPIALPIWPITSPNVDAYGSWEVCTGSNVKTVEGVAVLFNGNFQSIFPTPAREGTFRAGWQEAISVLHQEVINIINRVFEETLPPILEKRKEEEEEKTNDN